MRSPIISIALLLIAAVAFCPSGTSQERSGQSVALGIRCNGLTRSLVIHLPPDASQKKLLPVVIMLHGGGGNSRATIAETGWDREADRSGFIAIFPDGSRKDLKSPPNFRRNPQSWNDGSGRFTTGVDDGAFISKIIDLAIAKYHADPKRIYITGFSNGASMTFQAGCVLSRRVAAIAPVAGAFWAPPKKIAQPVSMLYITGTSDPLNPMHGGGPRLAFTKSGMIGGKPKPPVSESITNWLNLVGLSDKPVAATTDDGVSMTRYSNASGTTVEVYTIAGAGHCWPGGVSLLPEALVGARTDKLDATKVIWKFFEAHPQK